MAYQLTLDADFKYVMLSVFLLHITHWIMGATVGSKRKKFDVLYPQM
jgi:hypothetical protein